MVDTVRSTAVPHATPPPSRFARLAGWAFRHRWLALVAWLVVLLAVSAGSQLVGARYHNDFSLPGTQSQRALDTLRAHAPAEAGSTIQIVVAARSGLAEPAIKERVSDMRARVRTLPHVADVRDPYAEPRAISADGTIGYATVTLDRAPASADPADTERIIDTARAAGRDGLRVELGGETVTGAEDSGGGPAEGVGLLAALVILAVLFGSVLAASLPVIIAIFAVGTAIGLAVLASHVATVADFATPLMVLVGLGVGIDYALLLFSRYRAELVAGSTGALSAARALDTAGRTVLFAGGTVIVALLGLVALGLGSLQGMAVAVALTVLATVAASLTLLPALLAVMGGPIGRAVRRRAGRGHSDGARWARWSGLVQRHPWPATLVSVAALVALSMPVPGMRLGIADAGNGAGSRTSRQAYDLLARGFGPGFNGPLVVVVDAAGAGSGGTRPGAATGTSGGPGLAAAQAARPAIAGTPGVAAVSSAIPTADARVATLLVFPDAKPQDAATAALVDRLRGTVLPPLGTRTGATFLVGGVTASTVDFGQAIAARLPLFILVVVGLSALLLLVVFRSVLVPIKAALLNLLSVGASLGAVTLVFQHGVFGGVLGVRPGPIEAFVPVVIFAIAFGLSMDYEIFLLARMHEHWRAHRDAPAAIRDGMASTGRIVSAAAAIMVVVFASFLLDPGRMLKQFGFGLAVAVLVDALVIRCLIVPAVMQLLGSRAWWLPRWLSWLPRVALERDGRVPAEPVRRRAEQHA